jgi:hypothetical protein
MTPVWHLCLEDKDMRSGKNSQIKLPIKGQSPISKPRASLRASDVVSFLNPCATAVNIIRIFMLLSPGVINGEARDEVCTLNFLGLTQNRSI